MSDRNAELEKYKEQAKTDGENLVRNVFPKRVFEIQDLLSSKLFNMEPSDVFEEVNLPVPLQIEQNGFVSKSETRPDFGTPVYTFPSGKISHNTNIKKMIEATKPCLTRLMMEAQIVRMWIQFNVPRIEDGNNFGVGIQEDVLAEVSSIERDSLTFLDQFTRYYANRGKLIAKAAKFPHIDDYRECIRDLDEKQTISIRYAMMEIRNHYSMLHDLIEKNLDRIKVPRSNNTMNMY